MLQSSTLVLLMDKLINFIVDNWQWCSSLLVSIISFILLLIFRRKNIRTFYDPSLYERLIHLVDEAEKKYGAGHGKEKLGYVLDYAIPYVKLSGEAESVVKNMVELILSTPSKKKGN